MRSKKLSPRKATTEKKIESLKQDNVEFKGGQILVFKKYVSIWGMYDQPKGYTRITRTAFNKIIDWYNKEQSIE